jgi:hypothetical protein
MKLTIESTDILTEIDGVPVRVWEGRTAAGRPVRVFVHRIGSADPGAQAEMEAELAAMDEPAELRKLRAIPLRNLI